MGKQLTEWSYRSGDSISMNSIHVEVIADYGGGHSTDHAFSEVLNHFYRFDTQHKIRVLSEHPVYAFSTIETGFWIAQETLHSQHKDLVLFSNTAPRGDILWEGENRQAFVCGLLDNGIPVFAVNAGFNLSFVKDRLVGLWEVKTPNEGTQFRSRDYYPEATMAILNGDMNRIGKPVSIAEIHDYPRFMVGSVDGYGNLKTTIRRSDLSESVLKSPIIRVVINGIPQFALNSLAVGKKGKTGDLCMVVGSSGGRNQNFIEFIRLQGRAADDFVVKGPADDKNKIEIETIKI